MNAQEMAIYASENRALFYFVLILLLGACMGAAYMTILYWLLKFKYKKERAYKIKYGAQVLQLRERLGDSDASITEAMEIKADAEQLKASYRMLDDEHTKLKEEHQSLITTATRYRNERNKSDNALRLEKEKYDLLIAKVDVATQHVDLPLDHGATTQ